MLQKYFSSSLFLTIKTKISNLKRIVLKVSNHVTTIKIHNIYVTKCKKLKKFALGYFYFLKLNIYYQVQPSPHNINQS